MIELKTNKGEFVVVDLPTEVKTVQDSFCDAILTTHHDGYIETYYPYEDNQVKELKLICKLSEATEEDAKLIVDEHNHYFNDGTVDYSFRDYRVKSEYDEPSRLPFAIDSLKTLIKSNNITGNNLYIFKKT